MKIGLFGKGRLGSAIAAHGKSEITWALGRAERVPSPVDVAIDASANEAVATHLEWALETATDLVIGVTGFDIKDLKAKVANRIGVVIAPNFSLTVALFRRLTHLVGRYAQGSLDRDLFIEEHHHARKSDAPSGTAKLLAETLLKACPRKTSWAISTPKEPLRLDQLSIGVLRAGHTYSSHTVGLDTPNEVLHLHHASRSVAAYAEGALASARWLRGKKGVFVFDDVAKSVLDPLFVEFEP